MDSKQLALEPGDACEGEEAKEVEHHATTGSPRGRRCERGTEAEDQGFAFRFIGTSRYTVGVAWMRISAVPLIALKQTAGITWRRNRREKAIMILSTAKVEFLINKINK